jgi:surface protein
MTGITDRYGVHAHIKKATSMRKLLKSAKGAIDLPSIMIGVVVIGILSGIVGATVFVAIPWSQDKAASNSLSSISAAQESYRKAYDQYTTYDKLVEKGLMKRNPNYCSTTNGTGGTYDSASKSSTGKVYVNNAAQLKPREAYANEVTCLGKYTPPTPTSSAPTATTAPVSAPTTTTPPAVNPADTVAEFTIKCPVGATVATLPLEGAKGTVAWTQNGVALTPSNVDTTNGAKFPSQSVNTSNNWVYTAKFTGTFTGLSSTQLTATERNCIRSMDSWGQSTGTTYATYAFYNATNLTSVPANLPPTVTSIANMFDGATSFNSPNVSNWDLYRTGGTSSVNNISGTFRNATSFNQPLTNWNVSEVTTMYNTFSGASSFNQPLNTWNTVKVTNLFNTFLGATAFNQPLNNWKTGSVTTLDYTFSNAPAFNQNISNWDTSKVTSFNYTFERATAFNQPLNTWNTAAATSMERTFGSSGFNQPLNLWNTANVKNMNQMFYLASSFNQNISGWSVANVTTRTTFSDGSPLTAANSPKFV